MCAQTNETEIRIASNLTLTRWESRNIEESPATNINYRRLYSNEYKKVFINLKKQANNSISSKTFDTMYMNNTCMY